MTCSGRAGRAARCAAATGTRSLLRDQAFTGEIVPDVLHRAVRGREDHIRPLETVVGHLLPVPAYEVHHLLKDLAELLLVTGLAGGHGPVVQLIQRLDVVLQQLVLALRGDPDDHCAEPCEGSEAGAASPACRAPESPPAPAPSSPAGGELPVPSSAFIFSSSASTSVELESCLSWRSMSSSPEPSWVRSSNVPAASSSPAAWARAFMFSVLSSARCMARPTSAISSPTPVAASEIRTCASAAEYCALMTSFLDRNCSILVRSFCSDSVICTCCCSSCP